MRVEASPTIYDPAGAEVLSFYDLTFSERPSGSSSLLAVGVEKGQPKAVVVNVIDELRAESIWPDSSGYQLPKQELKLVKATTVLDESVEYRRSAESFLIAKFSPTGTTPEDRSCRWENCKKSLSESYELMELDLINPALEQLLMSEQPQEQLLAVKFFHLLCHRAEKLANSRGLLRDFRAWFQTRQERHTPLFQIWETHRKLDKSGVIPRLTELRSIAKAVAKAIPALARLELGDFYWGGHTLWHLRQHGAGKVLSDEYKLSVRQFGVDRMSQDEMEELLTCKLRLAHSPRK